MYSNDPWVCGEGDTRVLPSLLTGKDRDSAMQTKQLKSPVGQPAQSCCTVELMHPQQRDSSRR